MTELETLRITAGDNRLIAELHRPAQRNAINAAMVAELHAVCMRLEAQPRILILTGAGSDFAAGADIVELRDRGRDEALAGINRRVFDRIAALPLPTIAAVEGYALGGGAELAYACDLRVAGAGARFGNPEPALGILAAAGATYRLADGVTRQSSLALRLSKAVLDAHSAHPVLDDIAQAVLFESPDKADRMTRFLARDCS